MYTDKRKPMNVSWKKAKDWKSEERIPA